MKNIIHSVARVSLAAMGLLLGALPGHSQVSEGVIRIGFITDMSSLYADYDGSAGAGAIRMAIEDVGGMIAGKKVELLVADHQNKPDIAATKAREWFDQQGLDMLIAGSNSGAALAMAAVAREKKKPVIVVGAATSALTNESCSPYTIHYAYDTVALARGTAGALARTGAKKWFFVTADYAFGNAMQSDATTVVQASGGSVVGSVRHPLNASDFSSYLLSAQASKAEVLALANAGPDTVNSIKSASELGVARSMKLAAMLMFINDVHSLGLQATKGMFLTDSWYWNQSAESAAWARRFFAKFKRMPSSLQAADYSAALFYLHAVQATRTHDAEKVMAHMRLSKVNDMYAKGGYVRPDGRMVHDMFLLRVKDPSASNTPWDYFTVVSQIKGDDAFTGKSESRCPTWK